MRKFFYALSVGFEILAVLLQLPSVVFYELHTMFYRWSQNKDANEEKV